MTKEAGYGTDGERITHVSLPNRFAAFTTTELQHLLTGLAYAEHHASGPLRVEIIAEFERRKAT